MSKDREPSIDELMAKARSGAGAQAAVDFLGNVLWARLWKHVAAIANCPAENKDLILVLKAQITEDMQLAQDFRLRVFEGSEAVKRIKELYVK